MVEVKIGDTFSRYHWDVKMDTRTVAKVSDKSIWFEDASKNTFRVKNTNANGYYMPVLKGFDLKGFFIKDKD